MRRVDAPRLETSGQVAHERCGPAEVEIRIPRYAKVAEYSHGKPPGSVKVLPESILRERSAVADVAVAPQPLEEVACLLRERMIGAVAGPIEPPDLPVPDFRCQGVEHREYRSCSHTGTQ